jgi:hypothetical protein
MIQQLKLQLNKLEKQLEELTKESVGLEDILDITMKKL